jgi:hypothetical protein
MQELEDTCYICFERQNSMFLDCNHELCYKCWDEWCHHNDEERNNDYNCICPICRKGSTIDSNESSAVITYEGIHIRKGEFIPLQESEINALKNIDVFPDNINMIDIENIVNGQYYFIMPGSSNSLYFGCVQKIENNKIYLKDIYVIIREGRYFKSFPPNRIFDITDEIYIYSG